MSKIVQQNELSSQQPYTFDYVLRNELIGMKPVYGPLQFLFSLQASPERTYPDSVLPRNNYKCIGMSVNTCIYEYVYLYMFVYLCMNMFTKKT